MGARMCELTCLVGWRVLVASTRDTKKKTTSSRCCYCYCHRRRHHLATFQYMFSDAGTIDACICAMHTPCVAPLFGVRGWARVARVCTRLPMGIILNVGNVCYCDEELTMPKMLLLCTTYIYIYIYHRLGFMMGVQFFGLVNTNQRYCCYWECLFVIYHWFKC